LGDALAILAAVCRAPCLAMAAIAYAVVPLVDRSPSSGFVRDLDARGALIAQTAQEPLAELMRRCHEAHVCTITRSPITTSAAIGFAQMCSGRRASSSTQLSPAAAALAPHSAPLREMAGRVDELAEVRSQKPSAKMRSA